jgi:pimeloyl-ACP methyl ester carboxylesterase
MVLQVQGASIYVEDQGSGSPTLFLHGNPDSSILWRGIISRMKSNFRCIAPDLPGFGHSGIPAGFKYSLAELGQFIDDLVTALNIREPLNLAMHDFGGPYGLAWAVKHPQKVRRLAIMNTIFFSDYHWHSWAKIWRTWPLGELSMAITTWPAFRMMMKKNAPKLGEEHLRETYARFTPRTRRMVLDLYRATDPANYRGWEDELLQLTASVPALVLWGDRDSYVSPGYAERFGAKQVIHYPEYGHWLAAENPEDVARRLSEFFL